MPRVTRTLHEVRRIFMVSRSTVRKMRSISGKIVLKIKTHVLCSVTFFPENRTI